MRRPARLHLLLLTVLLTAPAANGVVIAFGDGSGNTSSFGFFGWDYVGEVNGLTATYLGEGWVITAGHVGPGDFSLEGTVYPWVPGSEQDFDNDGGPGTPDLLMFQISPHPALPPLPLRATPPPMGEFTLMIGCGRDRGSETSFDPNGPFPPDPIDGWDWLPSQTKRWGTNEVEGFPVGLVNGTVAFFTAFDAGNPLPEAQGADGDSGGAVSTIGTQGTELAGILYAIGPAIGQPPQTSLFTNLTFAARIDYYRDQIQDVLALPEPSVAGGLGWGIGLLAILGRRPVRSRR